MLFAGKFEEAIPLFQKAMRLEGPYMSGYYLLFQGISYHMLGRNEEALPVFKKFLDFCRKLAKFAKIYSLKVTLFNP